MLLKVDGIGSFPFPCQLWLLLCFCPFFFSLSLVYSQSALSVDWHLSPPHLLPFHLQSKKQWKNSRTKQNYSNSEHGCYWHFTDSNIQFLKRRPCQKRSSCHPWLAPPLSVSSHPPWWEPLWETITVVCGRKVISVAACDQGDDTVTRNVGLVWISVTKNDQAIIVLIMWMEMMIMMVKLKKMMKMIS